MQRCDGILEFFFTDVRLLFQTTTSDTSPSSCAGIKCMVRNCNIGGRLGDVAVWQLHRHDFIQQPSDRTNSQQMSLQLLISSGKQPALNRAPNVKKNIGIIDSYQFTCKTMTVINSYIMISGIRHPSHDNFPTASELKRYLGESGMITLLKL